MVMHDSLSVGSAARRGQREAGARDTAASSAKERAIKTTHPLLSKVSTQFMADPSGSTARYLAAPAGSSDGQAAILETALGLMFCDLSSAQIEARIGIGQYDLLRIFSQQGLPIRAARAAIKQVVSECAARELRAIQSSIEQPDPRQWIASLARTGGGPLPNIAAGAERLARAALNGEKILPGARAAGMSARQTRVAWNLVRRWVLSALSERANELERRIEQTWMRRWIKDQDWGIFRARARQQRALSVIAEQYHVSREFVRQRLLHISGLFPDLAAYVQFPERNVGALSAAEQARAEARDRSAERRDESKRVLAGEEGLPRWFTTNLISVCAESSAQFRHLRSRVDTFKRVTAALAEYPARERIAPYERTLISRVVFGPQDALEPERVIIQMADLALSLEHRFGGRGVRAAFRRISAAILCSPEALARETEELLRRMVANEQTVIAALTPFPRGRECVLRIRSKLAFSTSSTEVVALQAQTYFAEYLRSFQEMREFGIPAQMCHSRASISLGSGNGWQGDLYRDSRKIGSQLLEALAEKGLSEQLFLQLLKTTRSGSPLESRAAHETLRETFIEVLKMRVHQKGVYKELNPNTVRQLASMIDGAIEGLKEELFQGDPLRMFSGYLGLAATLQAWRLHRFANTRGSPG